MPQFIEPDEIITRILLLVEQAQHEFWLVSPDIHLTEPVFIRLAGASARGVKLNILMGTEPDPVTAQLLSVLQNTGLSCMGNLNVRCYFNEENIVVTSMSLGDMQGPANHDIALFISTRYDTELYNAIRSYIDSLFLCSVGIGLIPGSPDHTLKAEGKYRGFCIDCAMPVSYNMERPFCPACGKPDVGTGKNYRGNYCHSCGKQYAVTVSFPLCDECNKE